MTRLPKYLDDYAKQRVEEERTRIETAGDQPGLGDRISEEQATKAGLMNHGAGVWEDPDSGKVWVREGDILIRKEDPDLPFIQEAQKESGTDETSSE